MTAESEKKARLNLADKDKELARLQKELAETKVWAVESEQAIENRLHLAVGDKEKEISKLITQQHEICEQCAIALQAIAEKEQEIVEAIDAH